MQRLKKETPPVVAVFAILLALTAVQVLYWRGLIGGPAKLGGGSPAGGQASGENPEPPAGMSDVEVVTVAGGAGAGHRDGAAGQALLDRPAAVALDRAGNIYVADSGNHCLRRISPAGTIDTLAGVPGKQGYADGPAAAALFSAPAGVAVARDGTVLVADTGNHRIRRIARDGTVTTYAGAPTQTDDLGREMGGLRDGPAAEAQFRYPVGLAVDDSGAVYVADAGNGRVRRIAADGAVSTLPVAQGVEMKTPTAVALSGDGRVWVADTAGGRIFLGPRAGPLSPVAGSGAKGAPTAPAGIAIRRGAGGEPEVYVSDAGSNCLWRIGGQEPTLVAGAQDPAGGNQDGPGNIARFATPSGVAVGPDGSLYVADFGNNRVRRVSFPT